MLDGNWLGHATRASSRLYPHQWSWDAACIAIAYSHFDQERAETELRSLFEGQWRNGLLPHIRFTDGARYFPGPEFWQTELSPDAPSAPRTSGIVQPPVHATAVWQLYRNAPDRERARGVPPRADAAGSRPGTTTSTANARETARDWSSSGTPGSRASDNSPLWDEALARITPPDGEIPDYQRVDTEVVDSSQRPTNAEYDRYAYLVKCYRDAGYDQARHPRGVPVRDPGRSLQRDPRPGGRGPRRDRPSVGEDPGRSSSCGERRARASTSKLWSEAERHVPRLRRACRRATSKHERGADSRRSTAASSAERARRLLGDRSRVRRRPRRWAGPSRRCRRTIPSFDPARYWRGPVWPMISWVISPRTAPPRLRRRGGRAPLDAARARPQRRFLGALQRADRRGPGHRAPVLDGRDRARPSTRPSGRHLMSSRAAVEKGVEHASEAARVDHGRRFGRRPRARHSTVAGRATRKGHADAGNVVFLSTQLNAITESEAFRNTDREGLPGFGRTRSTCRSGTPRSSSTGSRPSRTPGRARSASSAGCTVTSRRSRQYLTDLTDVAKELKKAGIPKRALHPRQARHEQAVLHPVDAGDVRHGREQEGASRPAEGRETSTHLTYGQFFQWAKNLQQHFGRPEVGFPAGPTGLFPRFLQGYLIPGFTGHLNTSFKSKWAVAGWQYMTAALEVRPSAVADLQLHAGPAADAAR